MDSGRGCGGILVDGARASLLQERNWMLRD